MSNDTIYRIREIINGSNESVEMTLGTRHQGPIYLKDFGASMANMEIMGMHDCQGVDQALSTLLLYWDTTQNDGYVAEFRNGNLYQTSSNAFDQPPGGAPLPASGFSCNTGYGLIFLSYASSNALLKTISGRE